MSAIASQNPVWKHLQESEVHFLGCTGHAQGCTDSTASYRWDLAAASVVPKVKFPLAAQTQM